MKEGGNGGGERVNEEQDEKKRRVGLEDNRKKRGTKRWGD